MAVLKVLYNGQVISELQLVDGEVYYVGRATDANICLDGQKISRQHLKIAQADGNWQVQLLSRYGDLVYQGGKVSEITLSTAEHFSVPPYEFRFASQELNLDSSEPEDLNSQEPPESADPKPDIDFDIQAEAPSEVPSEAPGGLDFSGLGDNQQGTATEPQNSEPAQNSESEPALDDEDTFAGGSEGIPTLTIVNAEGESEEYSLEEGNTWILGRDKKCTIPLQDKLSSREHIEISSTTNGFFVRDLGSSNGSQLNSNSLNPNEKINLDSGDEITIGKTTIRFEVRDPDFDADSEEFDVAPMAGAMQVYQPGTLQPGGYNQGAVVEYQDFSVEPPPKKNKMRLYVGVVAILAVVFFLMDDEKPKKKKPDQGDTTQTSLSPEKQKLVDSYLREANELKLSNNCPLAISTLQKLHEIVPLGHKNSKTIEKQCVSIIKIGDEQQAIRQMKEEEKQQRLKVQSVVEQCRAQQDSFASVQAATQCLIEAEDIDPGNMEIQAIKDTVQARLDSVEAQQASQRDYARRVRKGKGLFARAQKADKNGKLLRALGLYQKHIKSSYPDPDSLKSQSRTAIKDVNKRLTSKSSSLKKKAVEEHKEGNYKRAIASIRKAIKYTPSDNEANELFDQYSTELNKKLQALYSDSILEEDVGNIELAKEKWRKIKQLDVKSGTYYKKATRKLKKYP